MTSEFKPTDYLDDKESMFAYIEELRAENGRLREALIQCGRSAGALLADSVSSDFLMNVPGEVAIKIARLSLK